MNKNPQLIKDKKVQFYLPQIKLETETEITYRKFPYTKAIYDDGGLWAYIRTQSFKEKFQNGYGVELGTKQCTINNNQQINNHYKAIYDGIVYDVSIPDTYEDYVEDMKFVLTEAVDNETYDPEDDEFETVEVGA